MRIIAGKYRGRRLKSPPSTQTRPTSDRLRETLFNILAPRIEGARFLDLCAGTGAVGIEALSRGASNVMFVDQSRNMCALIAENCKTLAVKREEFDVVTADALEYLRRLARKNSEPFDMVYYDPPYAADYDVVLEFLGSDNSLLTEDAQVIVEHYKKNLLADEFGRLQRYRSVKQGDSTISFYQTSS